MAEIGFEKLKTGKAGVEGLKVVDLAVRSDLHG